MKPQVYLENNDHPQIHDLAQRLGLPLVKPPFASDVDLVVCMDANGIGIKKLIPHRIGPIQVNFVSGKLGFRTQTLHKQKQMLARILKIKPNVSNPVRIADLTCGWGQDAWIMAASGAEVYSCEKNSVMAALIEDGLKRARELEPAQRFHFTHVDAENFIKMNRSSLDIDYIYLDPMYPPKLESALPSGELQILQALLQGEEVGDNFLARVMPLCRAWAQKGVLVKRPLDSAPIPDSNSIEGKTVRFDLISL